MPKQKRHSGAKKRFKVTGTGKLLRRQAMKSHLLSKKSAKRKRKFAGTTPVAPATEARSSACSEEVKVMPRVKRSVAVPQAAQKVLDAAKGYVGAEALALQGRERGRSSTRSSTPTATGSAASGTMRRLWIIRINAAARAEGLSYNQFVAGCRKAEIELDRKVLADLAVDDPAAFGKIAEQAKTALEATARHALATSAGLPRTRRPNASRPLAALRRAPAGASPTTRSRRDPRARRRRWDAAAAAPRRAALPRARPARRLGRDPLGEHRGFLRGFVAEQGVQTNEVQRSWVLLPLLLRVARQTGARSLRPRRARAERGLELSSGTATATGYEAGEWGPHDARRSGSRARSARPVPGGAARARSRGSRAGRDRPRPDRRHERGGRAPPALLRLGRARTSGSSGSTRRSRRCAPTRRSSCGAISSSCCPRCSRAQPRDGLTVVFQTATCGLPRRRAATRGCARLSRRRARRAARASSRRASRGTRTLLGPAASSTGPARSASLRATPTSTGRGSSGSCDHVASQPEAPARPPAARVAAPAREGGAVRRRGRGPRPGRGRCGLEPVELLRAGEDVEPDLLAKVSTMAHPPRVMGIYRREALPRGVEPRVACALARGRSGQSRARSCARADAFGASVALSPGCADPTGPKALRASAGAVFRVPLGRFRRAEREADRARLARRPAAGGARARVPVTYVLGAEREGLPDDVVAALRRVARRSRSRRAGVAERRDRGRYRALRAPARLTDQPRPG